MWKTIIKDINRNNLIASNKFDENDIIEYDFIKDLSFDKITNRLQFTIKHYTKKPKITRYVTINYVKTPIYEDYSERTKIVKKFNKVINPAKFVNEDILQLDLQKKFILKIIDEIKIIPEWRKKEIKLEKINNEIKSYKDSFRNFNSEKNKYNFKIINLKEKANNFWLALFWGFFTFFLNFIWFLSKKQAIVNKLTNEKNKKWNNEHKIEVDLKNEKLLIEINNFNKDLQFKIENLIIKANIIKEKEIKLEKTDKDNWIDLRNASNFNYSNLNLKKGVYIIWNKTKNKYYVGQSKNLKNRLLQHFKNGDVKNILFAKDWYNGDDFFYKYFFVKPKIN